jgi:hypothetical protein
VEVRTAGTGENRPAGGRSERRNQNGPGSSYTRAFEAKLGTFEFDEAAESLLALKNKLEKDAVPPPAFLAILTASGGMAYRREDDVFVIPLDRFGP